MRGVFEQNGGQLDGGWVCKDRPVVAILGQHRQPAGVIQVRVREHGVIDRFRIGRQRLVISVLQLLGPLKDAAIHQQPFARCLYQILGTRNASCRAKKSEFCHRVRILDEASCVLYYLGSYSCPVGPWRSWERASMASRRSWVRIPSAPPLLAHVFPRLYPFERNNKPLLRWSDAGRQRAPRLPQRELFQVAPESGAVAAGLSGRIQDPWPSHAPRTTDQVVEGPRHDRAFGGRGFESHRLHHFWRMSFHVYILLSETTNRYYVGQTQDVKERLAYHNANYSKSLRNRGPWQLVYQEEYKTRGQAMRRERQIKSWKDRGMIERLVVVGSNPIGSTTFGACLSTSISF